MALFFPDFFTFLQTHKQIFVFHSTPLGRKNVKQFTYALAHCVSYI